MNFLFIGLGSIGQRHLRNLINIYPKSKIYVIRKKYKVPSLSVKNKPINLNLQKKYKFINIKSINFIKKNKIPINAAFVCSPSIYHVDEAIKLVNLNINTFVEKPLGANLKNIDRLKNLLKKKKNIITMMGFHFRFNPIIKYIKEKLKSNYLGKINLIDANLGEHVADYHPYEDYTKSYTSLKKLGGGVALSQIHEVDYILELFRDFKIIKINSIISKVSTLFINVEDTMISTLCMKKNYHKILCSIKLNFYERPKTRTLKILGEKGQMFIDFNKKKITTYLNNKTYNKNFYFNSNDPYINEIKFFLKCIKKKKTIDRNLSILNGINTLNLTLKLKKNIF